MNFMTLLLIAILGTFIGGYLLSPSFNALCKRAWARISKQSLIKPKLMAELRVLEDIVPILLKINSIPSYPDKLKASDIRDLLIEIGNKTRQLEYKDFAELRGRLIAFSDHAPSLNVSMNSLAVLKLLGRETTYKLVEDIRAKVSETIKRKEKKSASISNKSSGIRNKGKLRKEGAMDRPPIKIKNSEFKAKVENAEEAVGMEVNIPADLDGVKSEVIARDVNKVVGFSTNQPMTITAGTCRRCNGPLTSVTLGERPSSLICKNCGEDNS